jgi:hypothetical protein
VKGKTSAFGSTILLDLDANIEYLQARIKEWWKPNAA